MSCVISSNPLLCRFALLSSVLPSSLCAFLAWGSRQGEGVPKFNERRNSTRGVCVLRRHVPCRRRLRCSSRAKVSLVVPVCVDPFRVVRLGLRDRDVAPDFAISSCSAFETETFAIDRVNVASFRDGSVLRPFLRVSNVDTLCYDLLTLIVGLAVLLLCFALSADVTSEFLRSDLELRQRLKVREAFLE